MQNAPNITLITAIAAGAVIEALLDTLIVKGVLSAGETRSI